MRAFLDGVNASSLSLMVAAAVALMPQLVGSPRRLVVLLVLTVLGIFSRGRFSPSWLVLLGGLAGLLFSL
jgi:chromate transport protein ChrA